MKTRIFLLGCSIAATCLLSLPLLLLPLISGCSTVHPGSQTAEVRAEQTLAVSLAALDSFVAFEHRRRVDVPALVRDVAYKVRLEAPKALDSANALRLAYKKNRTPQNAADLLTALAVVDAMVSEIRVWAPAATKSGGISRSLVVDDLIHEARASQTLTTQSWVALVPVFVDLAREVYRVVNQVREATKQNAEWDMQQEADFAAKLSNLKTALHWKL